VFRAEMGGAPAREVRGAAAVAKLYSGRAQGAGVALLDGRPGIVVTPKAGELMLLIRLSFANGRIAAIDVTNDPEKMRATEVSAI